VANLLSRAGLAGPIRRALPFILVGLAAALRLYHLDWNSLSSDEAYSWFFSMRPLGQIVADSMALRGDPHPPVYYLVLKPWMALAGISEVALRFPSALAGIVSVALIYRLGRRLFSPRVGLGSGLFAALGAFWVWNAQDARMYMLGGTLALAGAVCLVHGLQHGGMRWWIGYFAFTALACYTHIAGAFLLPFEGLVILVSARYFPRAWRRGLLALAAVGLVYLPYALNAWRASDVGSLTRHTPWYGELLRAVTITLSVHRAPLPATGGWVSAGFVGTVFALGALAGREARHAPRGFGRVFTLLFYLIPLAVISLLSLRQSVFEPRALMFFSAALALGVGAGWARLGAWRPAAGAIVGVGLIGVQVYGLAHLWRPGFQKEDWRRAAQYVADHIGPHDVILIHLAYYDVPFRYYFQGPAPVVTPFGTQIHDLDEVGRGLEPLTAYDTIWLVQSGEFLTDPQRLVQNWLSARFPVATEQYPHGISLRQFVVRPQLSTLPPSAIPVNVAYGNDLRLAGFELDAHRLRATETWLHPPSNWIHVRLFWSVTSLLADEPAVRLTLEDEPGHVWGENLQRSGGVRDFFPMTTWLPGALMRDDLDVNLNPAAPPGEYKLVLRLLLPHGTPIPLAASETGQDYLILQSVEIIR
jgi:hypothetical protein